MKIFLKHDVRGIILQKHVTILQCLLLKKCEERQLLSLIFFIFYFRPHRGNTAFYSVGLAFTEPLLKQMCNNVFYKFSINFPGLD